MRDYDLVIIGAGPGGYETALEAAGTYGMKTALIEKEALGGTCLNHGCIPTKTLLHSADLYRQMKECERFGLHVEGVSFDLGKIQDRKSEVLDTLRSGIAMLMSLSTNSYILSPRIVTLAPTSIPSLTLKFATDFLAFVTIGFCPEIVARSSRAASLALESSLASPNPILMTTFSSLGTSITLL